MSCIERIHSSLTPTQASFGGLADRRAGKRSKVDSDQRNLPFVLYSFVKPVLEGEDRLGGPGRGETSSPVGLSGRALR